ncbi:MAG TPA: TRAP transporter large permease [Candidatus Methylomirabilis sp.]|nr:TRAP transporter large permease [Candidatus Methylomirabilis sp.]
MTPIEIGILGTAFMVALLFSGISVGVAMALTGFLGFAVLSGITPALGLLKTVPYSTVASYTLTVIPLFILMGEMSFQSGISRDLYDGAHRWFGHLPGGLAMATIGAGAGFGAMCGSSAASTATFGSVALPEMRKYKYAPGFAAASVAAAGTLAILIPPSTGFIIYGVITEQSIGKLFIAGIIPGIILSALYILTIYFIAKRNPEIAPRGPATTWREKFGVLRGSWPMVVLFLFVMGGIWVGIFTATEAGAMGAVGSFLFMIWRRQCNFRNMVDCLAKTAKITAMVFLILIGAFIFGYFLAVTGVPEAMATYFRSLPLPPIMVILGILILYLFLGCIMDMLSMVVLTTPLFFPIVVGLGFDPIWYGVMVVVAMEQGQLTPPVGLNLYVVSGMARDIPMAKIIYYMWPYILDLVIFMCIMLAFPKLTLFLPSLMK